MLKCKDLGLKEDSMAPNDIPKGRETSQLFLDQHMCREIPNFWIIPTQFFLNIYKRGIPKPSIESTFW